MKKYIVVAVTYLVLSSPLISAVEGANAGLVYGQNVEVGSLEYGGSANFETGIKSLIYSAVQRAITKAVEIEVLCMENPMAKVCRDREMAQQIHTSNSLQQVLTLGQAFQVSGSSGRNISNEELQSKMGQLSIVLQALFGGDGSASAE